MMKLNKNKKKIIFKSFIFAIILIMLIAVYISYKNTNKLKSGQKDSKILAETAKTYTIKFDSNGGSGAPSNMTSTGGNITIPSTVPTKSGNQFWIWKIKGSDVSAYPGGTFNSIESYADSTGVVTFVAQWGYRITFDLNGGTGTFNDITTPDTHITLPSTVPTKSGVQFRFWRINGGDAYVKPNSLLGGNNGIGYYADSNGIITLVADWGYKLKYDANGGEWKYYSDPNNDYEDDVWPAGDARLTSSEPTKSGYAFLHYLVKGTDIIGTPGGYLHSVENFADSNGIVNLVADWGYTLNFYDNEDMNNKIIDTCIGAEGGSYTLPAYSPLEKDLIYWEEKETKKIGKAGDVIQNIEKYADDGGIISFIGIWGYKITYNSNGGTGTPETQTKIEGESINLSNTTPTRDGYEFVGWSKSNNATSAEYTANSTFSEDEHTTLYAVWKKKETVYTITYDANGGTGAPASQQKTEGETINLSSTIPTREGYKFLGWSTNKDATTATYTANSSFLVKENVTLYAIWEKEKEKAKYTITYDANGGTGAPASQQKTEGETINLSSTIPTREGYKFLGWSTNKDATTATYTANSSFLVKENVTLYAIWEKNKTDDSSTEKDPTDKDQTDTEKDPADKDQTDTEKDPADKDQTDTEKDPADKDQTDTEKDPADKDQTDTDKDSTDKDQTDKDKITIDDDNKQTVNNKNTINVDVKDNTKSSTTLPKAGINTFKIIIILVIAVCTFFGIKYKTTKLS